jgi:site-specific DNA recombinase
VVRLLVKEILVSDDRIVIRHSIPLPTGPSGSHDLSPIGGYSSSASGKSYLLRSGSERTALRGPFPTLREQPAIEHAGGQVSPDEQKNLPVRNPRCHRGDQPVVINSVENFAKLISTTNR